MKKALDKWNKYLTEGNASPSYFVDYVGRSWQVMTEVTLNRILTKHSEVGYIILTADRQVESETGKGPEDITPEERLSQEKLNKENQEELKKMIRSAGYGYIPVWGGYMEKDELGNNTVEADDDERSFLIPATSKDDTSTTLLQLGVAVAKHFNQDSFFHKPPNNEDTNGYWIDRDGQEVGTFTGVVANDDKQDYFTKLRKKKGDATYGRKFSYINETIDISLEAGKRERIFFIPPMPTHPQLARSRHGEIWLRVDETRSPKRRRSRKTNK